MFEKLAYAGLAAGFVLAALACAYLTKSWLGIDVVPGIDMLDDVALHRAMR